MLDRSKKRRRDPSQLAYQIMLESTGQAEPLNPKPEPVAGPTKDPRAVARGRLGGLKGAAREAALGPHKRSEIAAKTAKARWGKE